MVHESFLNMSGRDGVAFADWSRAARSERRFSTESTQTARYDRHPSIL
jgi:hypothetical protein